MAIKIKDDYKKHIIGFNKSSKALGDRDDLHLLWNMAQRNPSLKVYFDGDPSDEELKDSADENAKKNQKFAKQLK